MCVYECVNECVCVYARTRVRACDRDRDIVYVCGGIRVLLAPVHMSIVRDRRTNVTYYVFN